MSCYKLMPELKVDNYSIIKTACNFARCMPVGWGGLARLILFIENEVIKTGKCLHEEAHHTLEFIPGINSNGNFNMTFTATQSCCHGSFARISGQKANNNNTEVKVYAKTSGGHWLEANGMYLWDYRDFVATHVETDTDISSRSWGDNLEGWKAEEARQKAIYDCFLNKHLELYDPDA